MTLLGISTRECQQLIEPLLSDSGGFEQWEHHTAAIFARVVWSFLSEPGDSIAGHIVEVMGAAHALQTLIQGRTSVEEFLKSLSEAQSSELLIRMSKADLAEGLGRWVPRLNLSRSETALRQLALLKAKLLIPILEQWPAGLSDLGPHQPMVLWARGQIGQWDRLQRSIALVGARASTAYGEHVVMELATGLANHGVEIVSGGAYGIDGIAHRAALANQSSTTAILAGGIDRFYPVGHDALFSRILERGLILAESAPGTPPTRWRFLQRNRLIAAITQATIVIEAGYRSGSLNTAGHAQQLGRPLGVVPGPITSATSAGCHRLIREYGAECITGVDEALEMVGDQGGQYMAEPGLFDKDELRVLDALSTRTGRDSHTLAEQAGFTVHEVQTVLGLLELKNLASRVDNLWIKRQAEIP